VRTLATSESTRGWTLISLKVNLIKIGAKIVSHGRYVVFRMTEVAIPSKSSPVSCGSLPNCSRRPIPHGCDQTGCHAHQYESRKSYALMKVKSMFQAH
jgi:hypothetical protein